MREYDLDSSLWDLLVELFFSGLYVYAVFVMSAYLILSIVSFRSVKVYLHKTHFIDYKDILNSNIAPGISIVAPAYNEAATIIENIRSLLSLHYPRYEVIVVNDGSKDHSLDLVIEHYDLVQVDYCVNQQLPTKNVRGIYKSRDKAYSNLIVVDKENGGKSDALNCGMNVSNHDYVTCIDVDCILEQDALLKLMKPFTDETTHEIIATGGVVRVANSCEVEDGRLINVNIPENFLARTQALEYIRAFLLGRMAWSLLDGLILISGAIGVFKKSIVIECGGYDHKTVGEDMELVVRMRRWMRNHDRSYHVAYVPDPLCWTEVPESWKLLGRQRNRWTRGTIETLLTHKKMFFNPKHGLIGMLSYPYWFFFEWMAPLLEFLGIGLFFLFTVIGLINWSFFFLMLFLVYGFTLCFSVLSLLIEEITYHQYKKHSEIFKLLFVGLIEPLIFHPWVVYSAVKGNFDYLLGKSSWGDMARKGFAYGSRTGPKKISVVKNATKVSSAGIKKAQIGTKIIGAIGTLSVLFVVWFVYTGIEQDNFPKPEIADRAKVFTLDEYDEKEQSELVLLKGTEEEAYNPKSKLAREEFKQEEELESVEPVYVQPVSIESKPLDNKEQPKATVATKPKPKEEKPIAKAEEKSPVKPTVEPVKKEVKSTPKPAPKPTPKVASKPVVKPESKPASTAEGFKLVYHLIAGSFADKQNAVKFQEKLKQKGFNSQVLVFSSSKFRVTYGAYQLKDEAYTAREMLQRQGEAKDAWIYKESSE